MDESISKAKDNSKLQLKSSYAVKKKWKAFYTGGFVDVSSDGYYLFCMCDEKVQILDICTGLVEKVLNHDEGGVTCFKVSPDDKIVATATRSLLLKHWDWHEPKCIRTWKAIHTSPIVSMDFDETSTLLATGGSDGTIKVWDLVQQYCTHNFKGSTGVVTSVRFHPSNLTLYSAAAEYNIKVWDLNTSRCRAILEGHNSAVTCMQFPSEHCMISGGRDNIVALWDVPTKPSSTCIEPSKVIPIFKAVEDILILSEEHLPKELISDAPKSSSNNFYFTTSGSDGIFRVWESESGKCVCQTQSAVSDVSNPGYNYSRLLSNSKQIVCVTNDHRFDFFKVENLKLEKHLIGYNDDILDIKVLGKDESFIVVATNSPQIKVIHLGTSSCQVLHGHTDTVLCLDIFPNKVSFVSSSKDNSIRLWALIEDSFRCLAKAEAHTHAVSCVTTCKLNNTVFASGSEDNTLKIWTVKKSKKECVTAVRSTVKAHDKVINCIAVSPNDKLIATGSQDKLAKLWDIENGRQLKTFQGHKRSIWCAQFSPMDQVLATSSGDGTVKIWGLADGNCLKTFEGHDSSILKLTFLAKGTQILTTGSDGLMKLWTVKSSECVQTLDEHSDRVWALCTADSDKTVFTGGADSTIVAWEDVTEKLQLESTKEREKTILHHQELQNLLLEKKYVKALLLAIRLNQPFTALNVVKEILWEETGAEELENHIFTLTADQKQTLFKFTVSWNTNSRNCHEAQAVLKGLLQCTPPDEIEMYPDAQSIIEALLPYTDRHFQRLSRVAQQATFLDYTWAVMKMAPVKLD